MKLQKKYLFLIPLLGIFLFYLVTIVVYISRINRYNTGKYTKDAKESMFKCQIGNKIMLKIAAKNYSFSNYRSLKSGTGIWYLGNKYWKNTDSKQYAKYWKSNINLIVDIFKELEIKPNQNYNNKAVIHFRCSDIPFDRAPETFLYPKEYYDFVADKINKAGVDEIVFLNCSTYLAKDAGVFSTQIICSNYIETIADWLSKKTDVKINRNKICISIKDTYEIMYGSKLLVSTGGSFSFPFIVKGKNFISPKLIGPNYTKEFDDLNKHVHWTMWDKNEGIKHEKIPDYNTFDYRNYKSK